MVIKYSVFNNSSKESAKEKEKEYWVMLCDSTGSPYDDVIILIAPTGGLRLSE